MSVKKAIEERRSIRKFKSNSVSDELIKEIINAGRLAPSGSNAQPVRYYIISEKSTFSELKKENAFVQDLFYRAPLTIVTCGDPNQYSNIQGVLDQQKDGSLPKDTSEVSAILGGREIDRTVRDISIASSFMVLRATELGLGTCWVGLIRPKAFRKVLDIPDGYIIPFVLVMGYPEEDPAPRPRKPLDELILGEA